MKKNNSDDLFDFNDLFNSGSGAGSLPPSQPPELGGLDSLFGGDENCPLIPALMATMMLPRPLGMTWSSDEAIEKFLKFRGYRILTMTNDLEEKIHVAVKADSEYIPELQNSNVLDTFNSEMQDAIITILINLLGNDKNE